MPQTKHFSYKNSATSESTPAKLKDDTMLTVNCVAAPVNVAGFDAVADCLTGVVAFAAGVVVALTVVALVVVALVVVSFAVFVFTIDVSVGSVLTEAASVVVVSAPLVLVLNERTTVV